MCGILGIFNFNNEMHIDRIKFNDSAQLMKHRGPDNYSNWGINKKIELGHLRLSIIDLKIESNQPFFSTCKNFVIVFNGEIFNYLELKADLISKGYEFRTEGDTEVLLNSYIEWGDDCVNLFNGDWSFVIYDNKLDRLFCSRDRFGVKPFNYSLVEGSIVFSSEIKSILSYFPHLRKPNYNVIGNFIRNSLGAQSLETWFDGVSRLPPSHSMVIEDGKVSIKRYWDYPKVVNKKIDSAQAIEEYRNLFFNAVNLRMRSDVPVGTTLSSGLDSSSIVSVIRKGYAKEHNTFTAVFNSNDFGYSEKKVFANTQEIDEGSLVKEFAKEMKLNSHFVNFSNENFIEELNTVIYHLESGHSSAATVPLYKVMKYAKDYVTVVMEGQGADELLGGYVLGAFPPLILQLVLDGNISQAFIEFEIFRKSYSIAYSFKQYIRLLGIETIENLYNWNSNVQIAFGKYLTDFQRIKDTPFSSEGYDSQFNKELFKLHTGSLVNLLHYGDAISMANSIESRLPFMDYNLVEFSFGLPYDLKMKNGLGKFVHREAMKGIVPEFILTNPIKFGFTVPLSQHFNSLSCMGFQLLLSDRCANRDVFSREGLLQLIKNHLEKKKDYTTLFFRMLSVELWFRQFID